MFVFRRRGRKTGRRGDRVVSRRFGIEPSSSGRRLCLPPLPRDVSRSPSRRPGRRRGRPVRPAGRRRHHHPRPMLRADGRRRRVWCVSRGGRSARGLSFCSCGVPRARRVRRAPAAHRIGVPRREPPHWSAATVTLVVKRANPYVARQCYYLGARERRARARAAARPRVVVRRLLARGKVGCWETTMPPAPDNARATDALPAATPPP